MERSPELTRIIEILQANIRLNGEPVELRVNDGLAEQLFDSYAAVKVRRIALTETFEEQRDELMGYADLVQAGLI